MATPSRIGLRVPRLSSYHVIVAVVSLALLALLVLLSYGVALRQGGTFAGFSVNTVGRDAPISVRPASDFELPLFDGETFQLSDYHGQVVVINFWSSWCPPCRQEAPALEATWLAYRDRGVVLLGVDIWDTEEEALAFLREFRISYPNGLDETGAITVEYGVTGIPETYFIDTDGQLVRRWVGPLNRQQLSGFIEELLP